MVCFSLTTTIFACFKAQMKREEWRGLLFLWASFMSYILILSDTFFKGFKWMELQGDKLTSWSFKPSYFCLVTLKGHQSSQSRDKKEQTTQGKGRALAHRRQVCVEHEAMWQVWMWIMKLYSRFIPRKNKVQWNRPTYYWKWHKCWLVLLNRRKLNWLWFLFFF